ncbi:MAG TPA: hypothetical protein VJ876_06550 [Bacteroidales bacterium]|nr:hypothetical protein [Bacteroidales bacterium]
MQVVCLLNGQQIERDPFDLDYIEYDVVSDVVRTLEPLETNPEARVEVDLGESEAPRYNLVNCNTDFKSRFYQVLQSRGKVDYSI